MGKFENAVRAAKAGEKEVDVSWTKLSEKQVQELANAIAEGGRVERFIAFSCGITDQGATALAAGIHSCKSCTCTITRSQIRAPRRWRPGFKNAPGCENCG